MVTTSLHGLDYFSTSASIDALTALGSVAAIANPSIIIGQFGPPGGRTPGTSVNGQWSNTDPSKQYSTSFCTYDANQARFMNGATSAALTDGGNLPRDGHT